jgi:hypothetical protein
MSIQDKIQEMENVPLLGPGRIKAREMADALALQIDPNREPGLALRVLTCRFLSQAVTPTTLAQLAAAEAWATSEGKDHMATRLQLIWCAAVGRNHPNAVPQEMLDLAIANAKKTGALEAEWRIALATVEPDRASDLRKEALKLLPSPLADATRLTLYLDLAGDQTRGANTTGAHDALQAARALAVTHNDSRALCLTETRLAYHFLTQGLPSRAVPHLEQAYKFARIEEDDLSTIVAGSPLAAMYLEMNRDEDAAAVADRLLISGARRANWFAVVDGHMIRSALSLRAGDPTSAIERLVRAAVHLRELVPAAAINLIKGRLAELRFEMGAAVFDGHYQAAVDTHQPH